MLTEFDRRNLIAALEDALEKLANMPVISCQECVHFNKPVCKKWGENVPPEIQQKGCEAWEYDESAPPF